MEYLGVSVFEFVKASHSSYAEHSCYDWAKVVANLVLEELFSPNLQGVSSEQIILFPKLLLLTLFPKPKLISIEKTVQIDMTRFAKEEKLKFGEIIIKTIYLIGKVKQTPDILVLTYTVQVRLHK